MKSQTEFIEWRMRKQFKRARLQKDEEWVEKHLAH